ncbi:hypothetical protein Tco_1040684 [Tanacetum coccineum]
MLFIMLSWKRVAKIGSDQRVSTGSKTSPPYIYQWAEKTVPVAEGSSEETTTEGYMENYKNVLQDIRDQLNAEAEAGDSINLQDHETNLYWEFGKFTSRDGESLESYYLRFYKMMNELVRNQCDVTNHQVNVQLLLQLQLEWQRFVTFVKQSQELKIVSYHKLYDILKQHQTEVNEIRAERLARTADPLALVAQQQPVYHSQNHPNHYTRNSSTRSQPAATKNREKAIVNSLPPIYDQEPTMVAEDDEMSKEKEIDKLMALISLSFKKIYKPTNNNLRTSSNTSRSNQDNTARINRGSGHVSRECQKPKRAKDAAYHKEKMLLCKQEEAGYQLNAEQADRKDDTDDEPDDQELKEHYMYMVQIQEVTPDAADNSGPIFDTEPLQKVQNDNDNYNVFTNDREHPEQPKSVNDTYLEEEEHDLLASLIEKLKCKIDDSKNRNKFLESSNKAIVDKLKDLKKFQAELDRYHDVNSASNVEIDCAKANGDLVSYKMESQKSFNEHTRKINDLNKTISEIKKKLFAPSP